MAAAAPPPPPPRRVTYVLPAPTGPVPILSLPPAGISKRGHQGPFFSARQSPHLLAQPPGHPAPPTHPSHRLPVQALALDLSTPLASSSSKDNSPQGLLYTGGRDGLLSSWELGLPTRRRKRAYGRGKAESDSDSDGDSDDGDISNDKIDLDLDLDGLGNRPVSVAAARKQLAVGSTGRPRAASGASAVSGASGKRTSPINVEFESTWEIDDDRLRQMHNTPKAKFRQCIQSHTDVSTPSIASSSSARSQRYRRWGLTALSCTQINEQWINDIVLCNYNRTRK